MCQAGKSGVDLPFVSSGVRCFRPVDHKVRVQGARHPRDRLALRSYAGCSPAGLAFQALRRLARGRALVEGGQLGIAA